MYKVTREVRGIPRWLLEEYLEEVDGEKQEDGSFVGYDWTATIHEMDDYEVGSLSVARIHLELEGKEEQVKKVELELKDRFLRAGA